MGEDARLAGPGIGRDEGIEARIDRSCAGRALLRLHAIGFGREGSFRCLRLARLGSAPFLQRANWS